MNQELEDYLNQLRQELKRRSVPEENINHGLSTIRKKYATERGIAVTLGDPADHASRLYPSAKKKQYYLFTLLGLIFGVLGYVLMVASVPSDDLSGLDILLRYLPLALMPAGMVIDFLRYSKAL